MSSGRCGAWAGVGVVALSLAVGGCAGEADVAETFDRPDVEYTAVDGREGFRRTPLRLVGDVTLPDYSADPPASTSRVTADPQDLLLVFFGYLSCPDVCPTTMADIRQALDVLPSDLAERVEMAMVTVDLERDEGPEVASFVGAFVERDRAYRADSKASLDVVAGAFDVYYEIEEHEPGDTDYDVLHSAGVFVVDDTGAVVWDLAAGVEPEKIAATLQSIFDETYG